jgi:serine/threonine-protein kinase
MIGQMISHYRILEKLGEGGMGVVYKAEDTKLKRFVAIKFLPRHIAAHDEERQRFVLEAQAAAALNHPNITTIHAIEECGDELFIVLEFIEGKTLRDMVRSCQQASKLLSIDEAISYAVQIAGGLQAAHEKGIIHRDIKTANIMITDKGQAKIMDFGLAKIGQGSLLTKAGQTVGTIAYMSPEQARGDELDCRTDIWSFGVVLYEMLTGQLPFKAYYEQAVIYSILHEAPEPVAKLNPQAPEHLASLVEKALQKNPDDRYQQMADLLLDLKGLTAQATLPLASKQDKPIPAIVVLPLTDMSPQKDQEYFCNGLTEELIDTLAKIEGWRVVSRTSAFAFRGKEQDIRAIGKQLSVSHALEGSVRKAGTRLRITTQLINVADGFQLWSERYDRELDDVFAIQDDIAGAIVRNLKMKLTGEQETQLVKRYTKNLEAYNLYLLARFHLNKRAEEGLKKGLAYCEQAIALEPGYALAYAGLADGFTLLGFQGFLRPTEAMPKAKAAAEQALAIDEALPEAHTSLGCIHAMYDRAWPSSENHFKRAIALNPNHSIAHYWYAIWYLLPTGQFERCLAEIKKAQEIDPLSLVLNTGMGWVHYFARQYDRAIEAARKTLELEKDFVFARDILGQAYEMKGMYEEAIAELETAAALSNRRTLSLRTLGHVYAISGRRAEAQQVLDELLARAGQKYVSPYDIAVVYNGLGETDCVFEWLEKAYEEHSGWLVFLNVEPRFEGLRADTRFQALLKKVGLKGEQA